MHHTRCYRRTRATKPKIPPRTRKNWEQTGLHSDLTTNEGETRKKPSDHSFALAKSGEIWRNLKQPCARNEIVRESLGFASDRPHRRGRNGILGVLSRRSHRVSGWAGCLVTSSEDVTLAQVRTKMHRTLLRYHRECLKKNVLCAVCENKTQIKMVGVSNNQGIELTKLENHHPKRRGRPKCGSVVDGGAVVSDVSGTVVDTSL